MNLTRTKRKKRNKTETPMDKRRKFMQKQMDRTKKMKTADTPTNNNRTRKFEFLQKKMTR